jgi:hypothetical protein
VFPPEEQRAIMTMTAKDLFCTSNFNQCCGAGADSRGAKIKLPLGAGAEITNCGSSSFLFMTDLKKFYRKNHGR